MGACASAPLPTARSVGQSAEVTTATGNVGEGVSSTQTTDPHQLLRSLSLPKYTAADGKEHDLLLTPGAGGSAELMLKDVATEEEIADALEKLQTASKEPKFRDLLADLSLLKDVGLEAMAAGWEAPFMGLLVAKVVEVTGVKRVYSVKAKFEKDKSVNIAPEAPAADQAEDVFRFKDGSATLVFVVLFSDSTLSLRVRKGTKVTGKYHYFYGRVPVSELKQGSSQVSIPVTRERPDSANERPEAESDAEVKGHVKLDVMYKWLRGTKDSGCYKGPAKLYLDPRKLRVKNKGGVARIERISNVNHWLCSHNNLWSVQPVAEGPPSLGIESPRTVVSDSDTESVVSSLSEDDRFNSLEGPAMADVEPSMRMFTSILQDFLAPQETDTPQQQQHKGMLAMLFTMLNHRMDELEGRYESTISTLVRMQQDLFELQGGKGSRKRVQFEEDDEAMEPFVSGRFEYGVGRRARKRDVLLFTRAGPRDAMDVVRPVLFLGRHKTSKGGFLKRVELPEKMKRPGHYNLISLLPEDNTFGKGSMFMLRPGTKCIVFDLDGTLTVGDSQVVTQFALNAVAGSSSLLEFIPKGYDLKQRPHACTLARLWAAKGYQVIYISGRQGSFYNLTLEWLIKHDYPPGPIHLTRTHAPTLPVYFSVGNFKVNYMQRMRKLGLKIVAAYGNTGTDIRAYAAVGIPKDRTFIVGPNGGKEGTVAVKSFTAHCADVVNFPDSDVPIPYVELLWGDMPIYRRANHKDVVKVSGQMVSVDEQIPEEENDASVDNADSWSDDGRTNDEDTA